MDKSIKKRACLSLIIGSIATSNLLAEHMHKIINMSDRDVEVIADIPRAPDEKVMVGPGQTSTLGLENVSEVLKQEHGTWKKKSGSGVEERYEEKIDAVKVIH